MRTKTLKPRKPGRAALPSPASGRRTTSAIVKRVVEIAPGRSLTLDFNCAESPLSWLRTRKDTRGNCLIGDQQYCAGLRLHGDFMASHLLARTTSNWQAPVAARHEAPRSDLLNQSERTLAARQRHHSALKAVGPELSPILVEICCHATGIEAAERLLGMPRRSGKVVLDLALTRLARWYGLIGPDRSAAPSPMRSSALPDYRPPIA